ncbi:amidohydrolase family protein [Bengtsoniella intestinalis]|uniref:amidohydrolase family protein n=1 Tax=Bengtsoniella intestinalis TaxID=3073143 RepID=UPI00391F9C15
MIQTCDILLQNITYLDATMTPQSAACMAITNGTIVHIGDSSSWQGTTTINSAGLLWMAGLQDGHTHTSQQLLRGRLLDEKPVIWKRINVPFESKLTAQESTLSASVAAVEMIRSGTTAFVDVGGHHVEAFAQVYHQSGLRGILSYMTNDNPAMPESLRTTPAQALARQSQLHRDLQGTLLQGACSFTAPTAASQEMMETMCGYAKEQNLLMETHTNEYASEVMDFIEKYGARPYEWFEHQDLLGGRFLGAHGIFLSPSEMDIIAKHRVTIAHCPFSNCGKGVPSTPQLLSRGISVGFGSDGAAHGGLDLFQEMRLFRGVMNVTHGVQTADPQVMPAKQILKMATQGIAPAFNIPQLGTLTVGAPADCIAIDTQQLHLLPTQNITNSLVESGRGSDVTHMIVNGKLLMENRHLTTLDEEKIRYEAVKYSHI